jgi:hypothetical protein
MVLMAIGDDDVARDMALQSYSLLVYVTRNIIPENWRRYRQKANQKAGSVVNDSKGR